MQLRTYQTDAIVRLRESLQNNKKRIVMALPTGAGKTVIAASLIRSAREKNKRVAFVVPSLTLIDQTVARFESNGIWEIGVMQANHEMTDPNMPVQVCSIQTLARRNSPNVDMVIVDECHVQFKFLIEWMGREEWKDIPFVGLSATPWAKGMGQVWDDLIIATTTSELIELGHLSPFKCYAPAHPDLSGVKTIAGDFDLKGLSVAMQRGALVADIVSTWLQRGEDRPTVCFAVDRLHAKNICDRFVEAGVAAEYMDAFTPMEERAEIVKRFAGGDTRILCNVGVLTTGFDADVRCIILARPTKSEMLYVQMIGRGLRTADGKDHCLILDHSDTTVRLGFVTDIHHELLDDGNKNGPARPRDAKPLPKECPSCAFLMPPKTKICPACGFEKKPTSNVEEVTGDLVELTARKTVIADSMYSTLAQKQQFYSELLLHAHLRGYKPGWAAVTYKDKFGNWPPYELKKELASEISPTTQSWIIHRNIAWARSQRRNRRA